MSVVGGAGPDQAALGREDDRLDAVAQPKLVEDVGDMGFRGVF